MQRHNGVCNRMLTFYKDIPYNNKELKVTDTG